MSTIDSHDTERRDFLYIATGSFAAVGAAATAWPFIDQMNPDASVKALASVEVDISPIEEGQSITISWRGNPVFIRHRTAKEIEEAKSVSLADLPDQDARNPNIGDCARPALAHDNRWQCSSGSRWITPYPGGCWKCGE